MHLRGVIGACIILSPLVVVSYELNFYGDNVKVFFLLCFF